jgi:hypothetical protein
VILGKKERLHLTCINNIKMSIRILKFTSSSEGENKIFNPVSRDVYKLSMLDCIVASFDEKTFFIFSVLPVVG